MRRRAEIVAAVVNGLVVLFLPLIVVLLGSLRTNDYSTTVHPAGWSPLLAYVREFTRVAPAMVPFALVAAWRTWVHARRWLAGERGWQGVAEAGLVGLACALLILLPGMGANVVRQPIVAWTYIMLYGGLALVLGLGVGGLLHITAVIILTFTRAATA